MRTSLFVTMALLGVTTAEPEFIEALGKYFLGDTAGPTIEKIVAANGFVLQSHEVHTEDGYILGVYRIPGLTSGPAAGKALPILL